MLGDLMKVLESKLTLLQLPVTEHIVDEPIDHSLYSCGRGVGKRAAGRFDDVCQHHQPRFLGLRFGAGIAVIVNINDGQLSALRGSGLLANFLSFNVKKRDEAGSVVLADYVRDGFAQAMILGQLNTLF